MSIIKKKWEITYSAFVPEDVVASNLKQALESKNHIVLSLNVLYLGHIPPTGNPRGEPRYTYQVDLQIKPLDK